MEKERSPRLRFALASLAGGGAYGLGIAAPWPLLESAGTAESVMTGAMRDALVARIEL